MDAVRLSDSFLPFNTWINIHPTNIPAIVNNNILITYFIQFTRWLKKNITKLLLNREYVFKWPDVPFKDFNEWAVADNLTEIDYKFVLENLY